MHLTQRTTLSRRLIMTTAATVAVLGGITAQTTATADPAPRVPAGVAAADSIPTAFRMAEMHQGQIDDPGGYLGSPVTQTQYLLRRWSPGLVTDGIFGVKTKAAVEAFQRAEGLPVTGKLTRPDFYRLFVRQTVRYGSTGDAVKAIQVDMVHSGDPEARIDGLFGPATRDYVLASQRSHGNECHSTGIDGIVGPLTWSDYVTGEHDADPCLTN